MTTMAIDSDCGCGGNEVSTGEGMVPANPYTALQYHFGMLLGVDDLDTAQAYPRGKIRLHNAWLHREGVVWGFDVQFNQRRELAVRPGLALDGAGHELHLDTTACVDLGKWFDKHKDDEGLVVTPNPDGGTRFDVHVVARFRACLARPVPAISDPCGPAGSDTAYSRVNETVELLLRPGKAPVKDPGYHRLRILFSLEDDDPAKYDEVRVRREAILALPTLQQPRGYLQAFREFAALDEIDLAPATDEAGAVSSLFPEDPSEVVLADVLGIVVGAGPAASDNSAIAYPLPEPNVRIRRSHVATATIQELLCGPMFAMVAAPPSQDPDTEDPDAEDPDPEEPDEPDEPTDEPQQPIDAGGPRVDRASVTLTTGDGVLSISMTLTAPVDEPSATAEQFSVSTYSGGDGWQTLDIDAVTVDNTASSITLALKTEIATDTFVRLGARGTGPTPILGTDLVPFAGAVGGPPGTVDDGYDFHIMLRSS